MAASETRIYALDGLRGIAVIMVMTWHLTGSMVDRDGWGGWLYAATIFGRSGVDLFFVLSGFLIIGILVDNKIAGNLIGVFFIRRCCRILPPYVALIAVFWLCYAIVGESAGFNTDLAPWSLLAQLGFGWNVLMSIFDGPIARGFSVTWSVDIEEHFYWVAPFVILLWPREKLWRLLLAIGLLSWLARAGVHLALPRFDNAPYMLTPFRLDGLCAGGLLAIGYRNGIFRMFASRYKTELLAAAIVGVATVPFMVASIRNDLNWHMYLWGHAYLDLVYVTVIAAVLFNTERVGILKSVPLRLAGRYSYSLYLFHPLFLSLFFTLAKKPELVTNGQEAALTAGSLLATVVFCIVLFETVEKRFQALGHRFRYVESPTITVVRPAI
jgi:peptidoglycan/LPS O-acetylase OafA/YrhL